MAENTFAWIRRAADGGGVRRKGAAGEWDMTLAREKTRRRVQSDPTSARKINFTPGMQIGEILLRAGRAIEGLYVGRELDEVTGDEPRSETDTSTGLHEQPG